MAKRKDPGLLPDLARPDRYHHGDLRAALVQGALLLLESGAHGFSLRTVARSVGVSPAAVYHHFRDVRALLAAVAEEGLRALAAQLASTNASLGPAVAHDAAARAIAAAYLESAQNNAARYHVMFQPDLAPRAQFEGLAAAEELVVAELLALVARGPSLDAATARARAWGAWAALHGATALVLLHAPPSARPVEESAPAPAPEAPALDEATLLPVATVLLAAMVA